MQQANLKAAAGDNPDSSIAEQTALAPGTHEGHEFKPQPKGKGKGGGKAGGLSYTKITNDFLNDLFNRINRSSPELF